MMNKKSLKEISWKVSEAKYRQDKSYSYSLLARYNNLGFSKIKDLFQEISSASLSFGSMVDTLLTEGIDKYNELYIPKDFDGVGDKTASIIDIIYDRYGKDYESMNSIPYEELLGVLNELSYQNNWTEEKRVEKIIVLGDSYYKFKILSKNKEIVSVKDYSDGINCFKAIHNNSFINNFFRPNPMEDDSIERLFQLKFKSKYKNIDLKCMADLLVVDHKNKVIIPCDLKTTFPPEYEFYNSFVKWGYYIQAQLYWYIIKQNLLQDDYFKDFELLDFRFIVVSRESLQPIVWTFRQTKEEETIVTGKNKTIELKNWRVILEELHFYLRNKSPVPRDIKINRDNDLDIFLESM